jgi:heptosyltransferase-2
LQFCPFIDEVIIYDSKDEHKNWWDLVRLSRKLRNYKFDYVIDFQNNKVSHLLGLLSHPRKSFGYRNNKLGFLVSHPVKDSREDIGPIEHQFQILSMLGIPCSPDIRLGIWPTEDDKKYIEYLLEGEWLANNYHIVGINISASPKWQTKNWPLEYIAKVCDILAPENIRVVITGVEQDRPKARQLLGMTKTKPANMVGKTDILQLAALIKRCKVFVTPDSAPMHIAAAVGTPVIALFGPTNPARHLPTARHLKVFKRDMECSPCYSPKCKITTHACMKDISPEEVVAAIKEMMEVEVR